MINFIQNRRKKNRVWYFLPLIFLFLVFSAYYFYSLNTPVSGSPDLKLFSVMAGQGSTNIAQQLKKQGFIRSPLVFQFYAWTQGIGSKLKSGEYFLSKNLSSQEIAEILFKGPGKTKEKSLTFIEGWTINNFADYLENQGIIKSKDFLPAVQKKANYWDQYEFLVAKPKNLDLEGYLFPDTYRIYTDATAEEIINKMLDNLGSKLTDDLRAEITRQGKTVHEILTLASILEKEVSTDQDRKMVADIFYKRLKVGIALQADSTVNYATGKSVSRASADDLKIDSPYNTYKYRGLPTGPICNPGLSAILAAIYPTPNSYYYFLTTPEGKVIYSKIYEEHVTAKNKYY